MPYNSVDDLPPAVQNALPSTAARQKFVGAFNSCMSDGGTESSCFRIGYAAARKANNSNMPVGKALVIAKRALPGWAWSVLQQDSFMIPNSRTAVKSEHSIAEVRKLFSFSRVQQIRGEPHNLGAAPFYVSAIIEKLNNPKMIQEALDVSCETMPGWASATLRQHHLPPLAPVVFVCKDLEGKALDVFESVYIPLLGISNYRTAESLSDVDGSGAVVVALGKQAGCSGRQDAKLPHPKALLLFGDSGEVSRKIPKIRKMICALGLNLRHSEKSLRFNAAGDNELSQDDTHLTRFVVPIVKSNPDKQIVTGIVLEPWTEDSQNDILTPDVIERAAHLFMAKSRVIGVEHSEAASGAMPVESYIVPYPTVEDYKRATSAQDHTSYAIQLGEQLVKSGSWVLSTKLDDSLWESFKAGEVSAYSIGGYGKRTNHQPEQVPSIKYVEASKNGNGP